MGLFMDFLTAFFYLRLYIRHSSEEITNLTTCEYMYRQATYPAYQLALVTAWFSIGAVLLRLRYLPFANIKAINQPSLYDSVVLHHDFKVHFGPGVHSECVQGQTK